MDGVAAALVGEAAVGADVVGGVAPAALAGGVRPAAVEDVAVVEAAVAGGQLGPLAGKGAAPELRQCSCLDREGRCKRPLCAR